MQLLEFNTQFYEVWLWSSQYDFIAWLPFKSHNKIIPDTS